MNQEAQRLKKHFSESAAYKKIHASRATDSTVITGLLGSAKGLCCALLSEEKPLIVVARDDESAAVLRDDLAILAESGSPVHFEIVHLGPEDDTSERRREILDAIVPLLSTTHRIIVVSPTSLKIMLPSFTAMKRGMFSLRPGDLYERDDLVMQLVRHGYQRKQFVDEEGDIAVRGGIVDVYPFARQQPVRIDFRDIEIESIRSFDLLTQRSIRPLDEVVITLASGTPTEESGANDSPADTFNSTFFDYIAQDSILFLDEPAVILSTIEDEALRARIEAQWSSFPRVLHTLLDSALKANATADFNVRPQPRFGGSIQNLADDLISRASQGFDIQLYAETAEHATRLRDMLLDIAGGLPEDKHLTRALSLSEGFILPDEQWGIYMEHEVFERNRVSHKPRTDKFRGITLRELRKLQRGDFIVHVDKGIGRFAGLETIEIQGVKQESVKLIYRDSDILFVHLNHIDRLQKYVSKEGRVPHLSKLGTQEWEHAKARMKKRAMEIAAKLLKIHAKRKIENGFAFAPDSQWQREMEASFLYEDTPDQSRASQEVKRDMEAPHPMDRLVCGDVGYGKTEVALRAAFKAVQNGKQVAVLVPTTILAQQHYNTFHDRLEKYAVRVEALSRFRSKAEQRDILKRLKSGNVDVVIGTHRLLSKDVAFSDIGLLIIDEEQRFGVTAKERLREMRSTVDTLTLTATPIPRTMNLALAGILDISVIETPPRNRRPIQTQIVQWERETIRHAILNEMHRGGQVFIVHDHIQGLTQLAEKVRAAVPEARLALAHGQMQSTDLENIMMDFMQKKYDALICTKIVESGLDIPSVNTILITKAENFGLAELYQLRGRAGRSNTQAFAYLIVPPLAQLTTQALKRLYALEEFTDLGSGFQLAMRDLELRGAGTILGGEQSGFIDALGFEMYNQLLEQAVRELKTKEYKDIFRDEIRDVPQILRRDVNVQVSSDALIPQSYIPDDSERFEMYKRLYRSENALALRRIRDEMLDRFGAVPPQTESLFVAVRLKSEAGKLGFDKVIERAGNLHLELSAQDAAADEFYDRVFPALMQWVTEHSGSVQVATKGKTLVVTLSLQSRDAVEVLENLTRDVEAKVKEKETVETEGLYQ